MTDLHTHILPGIDDGSPDVETSLAMLRMERDQGVDTVALTPHFYRDRERPARFLERRKQAASALAQAILALPEEERDTLPRLVLGAEVAWVPNLAQWDELPQLAIGEKTLLLELPFSPWNDSMIDQLYDLMGRTELNLVIAHLERYLPHQRPDHIREIMALGVPIQLTAGQLLRPWHRRVPLKLLKQGQAHILASDCHNLTGRAPDLGLSMAQAEKKLGQPFVQAMTRRTDELVP